MNSNEISIGDVVAVNNQRIPNNNYSLIKLPVGIVRNTWRGNFLVQPLLKIENTQDFMFPLWGGDICGKATLQDVLLPGMYGKMVKNGNYSTLFPYQDFYVDFQRQVNVFDVSGSFETSLPVEGFDQNGFCLTFNSHIVTVFAGRYGQKLWTHGEFNVDKG